MSTVKRLENDEVRVRYCSGHQRDGDYAVEVDFALAARQGARVERPRIQDDVLREPIERVLREVERQWRERLGWRARLDLRCAGEVLVHSMLCWWHVECRRLGCWGGIIGPAYLGMAIVGPSESSGALKPADSPLIYYENLEVLPVAFASFFATPAVGERLARLFGWPREERGR